MFPPELISRLAQAGVVATLTLDDVSAAVPVARALQAGGITVIELTYRTAAASEIIRRIRGEIPDILVGAGTLLAGTQVADAHAAGAAFGVAPGCNPRTIRAAQDLGLPFAPGVATATDIEIAVENDCRVLKYFPAESTGGLDYLQTVTAPFAHLDLYYIPLGGIDTQKLVGYLQSPRVLCVGGSWLVRGEAVRARNWSAVKREAAEAAMIVRKCRA